MKDDNSMFDIEGIQLSELTAEGSDKILNRSITNKIQREVNMIKDSIEPIKQYSYLHEVNHGFSQIIFGAKRVRTYSLKTQRWVGTVLEVREDRFIGKLQDLTNPGTEEIEEFLKSKISPEDLPLLSRGAIFYWSIGDVMTNSQLEGKVILRFRRAPDWTTEEIDEVADDSKELLKRIFWDDSNKQQPNS